MEDDESEMGEHSVSLTLSRKVEKRFNRLIFSGKELNADGAAYGPCLREADLSHLGTKVRDVSIPLLEAELWGVTTPKRLI